MGKIFNYEKLGKGIAKTSDNKKYTFSNFLRIYKEKFFKLLGLNLIYCVILVAVLALIWMPLNKVTANKNKIIDNMESAGYNSVFVSSVERMISAYNIQESELDAAWIEFEAATAVIKDVNEAFISGNIFDGNISGFDSNKFTDEQLTAVGFHIKSGFETLGFTIKETDGNGVKYYELIDGSGGSAAKLTYVINENSSDTAKIEHGFPVDVKSYGLILLCFLPLILLGPINLCLTRITRDYIREEPSFMFSDMWDTFKKNWWQSFVIAFIQYVSIACASLAVIWYYSFIGSGFFFIIGFAACLFMTYVFISMHFYVPLMQVTLNLNLRKIYKNALYFTIIGMFKNVLLIIIAAALILLIAVLFIFGISTEASSVVISLTVTFILICLFSLWFYLVSCIAYPSIQKFVIDPYYAEQNIKEESLADSTTESNTEEVSNFFNNENTDEGELPEYVYYNGRMVHRSAIEQETLFEDDIDNNN